MIKDYYSILGVDRNADSDTIKGEYRNLATKWHPDMHQDEEKKKEAEEKFKEISEAYSVLSDPEKKSNYDLTGSPENGNPFGFKSTGTPFDIMFNMGRRGPVQPRPSKGQSVQLGLEIPLVDALFGTTRPISYQTTSACACCYGRGGIEFDTCPECNGIGMKTVRNTNMFMQTTCDKCRGQGSSIKTLCPDCNGQAIIQESRNFNVIIPEGITHKTVLKLADQGGRGFNGGPSGDVLVQVRVQNPAVDKLSEEEREILRDLLSR